MLCCTLAKSAFQGFERSWNTSTAGWDRDKCLVVCAFHEWKEKKRGGSNKVKRSELTFRQNNESPPPPPPPSISPHSTPLPNVVLFTNASEVIGESQRSYLISRVFAEACHPGWAVPPITDAIHVFRFPNKLRVTWFILKRKRSDWLKTVRGTRLCVGMKSPCNAFILVGESIYKRMKTRQASGYIIWRNDTLSSTGFSSGDEKRVIISLRHSNVCPMKS